MNPEAIKEVSMDLPVSGKRKRRRTKKADVQQADTRVERTIVNKEIPATPQKIVLAPPKPKHAKVLLVPKDVKQTKPHTRKQFVSKRFLLNRSPKLETRRRKILAEIDTLPDEKVRDLAVSSNIFTAEAVKKVPIKLVRSVIKDCKMIKGSFL